MQPCDGHRPSHVNERIVCILLIPLPRSRAGEDGTRLTRSPHPSTNGRHWASQAPARLGRVLLLAHDGRQRHSRLGHRRGSSAVDPGPSTTSRADPERGGTSGAVLRLVEQCEPRGSARRRWARCRRPPWNPASYPHPSRNRPGRGSVNRSTRCWAVPNAPDQCGSSPFARAHDEAFIEQAEVIEKLLTRLGLWPAPAHNPPAGCPFPESLQRVALAV